MHSLRRALAGTPNVNIQHILKGPRGAEQGAPSKHTLQRRRHFGTSHTQDASSETHPTTVSTDEGRVRPGTPPQQRKDARFSGPVGCRLFNARILHQPDSISRPIIPNSSNLHFSNSSQVVYWATVQLLAPRWFSCCRVPADCQAPDWEHGPPNTAKT